MSFLPTTSALTGRNFAWTGEDLSAINEKLIFAHLTGYATPVTRRRPAFDALLTWRGSGLI